MIDESEMSDRSKELLGSREAEAGNELETEQHKSRPLGQRCIHPNCECLDICEGLEPYMTAVWRDSTAREDTK